MGLQSPTRDTMLQGAWHVLPLILGVLSSGPQSWALGAWLPSTVSGRVRPGAQGAYSLCRLHLAFLF